MGGKHPCRQNAAVLAKVQDAFDKGESRWAAELCNHIVFSEPKNVADLNLQADIFEQLGCQCENGTWRCVYLMGATELRLAAEGKSANPTSSTINPSLTNAMDDDMSFDFMALHLNAPRAGTKAITIEFTQTDRKTTWALQIKNGVLHFHKDKQYPQFDAKIQLSRDGLSLLILSLSKVNDMVKSGKIQLSGNAAALACFLFDVFTISIL